MFIFVTVRYCFDICTEALVLALELMSNSTSLSVGGTESIHTSENTVVYIHSTFSTAAFILSDFLTLVAFIGQCVHT